MREDDSAPLARERPASPAEISEDEWIIWAYRLLLGRMPEDADAIGRHRRVPFDRDVLRQAFINSAEFRTGLASLPREDAELTELKAEFAAPQAAPQAGFFIDFLGTRTRCAYLPPDYARFSGAVETPGGGGSVPLHDGGEMVALLRAVRAARGTVTVVELGAGWGPWLVAAAAAARRRGLPFRLVGVEASEGHLAFMRTHFADNGIDPDAHRLLLAAAGAADGVARFPVLPDPALDWGAAVGAAGAAEATVEVACLSLPTLLHELDRVDLLHCDVQGAEEEVLVAAIDVLDRKVARLVVGTHGRGIEARLHALFADHGWAIEHDAACAFRQIDDLMVLVSDGTQVWRNPRVAGA